MNQRRQSAGCSSPRPEALAGRPLLLSIYQVKVIALETWDLLTLRDERCLVCGSAKKASCVSGQSLWEKASAWALRLAKGPDPALAWRGQLVGGGGCWAGEEAGGGTVCTLNDLMPGMCKGDAVCKLSWMGSPSFRDSFSSSSFLSGTFSVPCVRLSPSFWEGGCSDALVPYLGPLHSGLF